MSYILDTATAHGGFKGSQMQGSVARGVHVYPPTETDRCPVRQEKTNDLHLRCMCDVVVKKTRPALPMFGKSCLGVPVSLLVPKSDLGERVKFQKMSNEAVKDP